MMIKDDLLQMISTFREEFEKLSPEAKKHEQLINSFKAPCQIHLLTSPETKTHLLIKTHFSGIPDKTIEIVTLLLTNYIDELKHFEDKLFFQDVTYQRHSLDASSTLHPVLVSFGISVKNKHGLLYTESRRGSSGLVSDNIAVWNLYGNLEEIDFDSEAKKIIGEYKTASDQAKEKQKVPEQITASIPDKNYGLGTYFYPPILIGEIRLTMRDEIEQKTYELFHEKALLGEFDGVNYVISKGGLIGLETNDHDKAEKIFNIIMGTATLMGVPLHALKSHEIANITIDKKTYNVTGSSWEESTYRMMMFTDFLPYRSIHNVRIKITQNDLEQIITKAKSLTTQDEQLNKLKLVAGSFTHLDNHEFSQSFIMSWTVIEIHVHELWTKKMQTAGITKKIKEDLDRWDFYRVLEVLHLDKIISNDDYYEMKHLNGLRNDIIHDGHQVTRKQAHQCYDLAKNIIKIEFGINQVITGQQVYFRI